MPTYSQIEFRPAYDVPVWIRFPRLYWCSLQHASEWLSILKQRQLVSLRDLPYTVYLSGRKELIKPGDREATYLITLLIRCRSYPMKIYVTQHPNEIA